MNNQLELVKWLKDQLQRTDIEFGEYQRNRNTLESVNALDEESEKSIESNINRLRFRYRWIEEQIQSFNKVSDTIKDNMWYIDKHNLV